MKIFSDTNLNAIFAFLRYCLGEKEDMNRVAAGTRTPGDMEKTALLGARNRYAIRLAGHQSPRQVLRDGTARLLWGSACNYIAESECMEGGAG